MSLTQEQKQRIVDKNPAYAKVYGLTPKSRPFKKRDLPCVHLVPGVLEFAPCACEEKHVRGCRVHGTCTLGNEGSKRACCKTCDDHENGLPPGTTTAVTFNQAAGGIGDGILGLTACAGFKKHNPAAAVEYKVSGQAMPFVRLFEGYDLLSGHSGPARLYGDRQMDDGYAHEYNTKSAVPRWIRYANNVGAPESVVPPLRDREAVMAAGADKAGVVALCPFSHASDREYGVPGWIDFEARLIAAGIPTVVVHSNSHKCWLFRSPRIAEVSPERTAGVLANAAVVVGGDSGLTHLGGALGTPTVALCGQTRGDKIYGVYGCVTSLQGPLKCTGCYCNGPWFGDNCRPRCQDLQAITPDRIFKAVQDLLRKRAA